MEFWQDVAPVKGDRTDSICVRKLTSFKLRLFLYSSFWYSEQVILNPSPWLHDQLANRAFSELWVGQDIELPDAGQKQHGLGLKYPYC